jgi:hypothetical protein
VESKLIPCEQCDAGVVLLIVAPGATDPGRFEDSARRIYLQVMQMHVPSYVIGLALDDGPLMDRSADILRIGQNVRRYSGFARTRSTRYWISSHGRIATTGARGKRFLSAYGPIAQHFRPRRHRYYALELWQEITGTATA